jgi:two-component system, response regulator PdtaR
VPTNENRAPTHVLLVDDDRPILAALAAGMRRAGYTVSEAQSGEAALDLARSTRFDVALLDVRMPGMSGLDLAKELTQTIDLPFLFMSAHSEIDVVKDAAEYGALGYLLKPVDISQVVPAIEAALARAQELRKLRETEAHLNVALASGREINIAIGIIMERNRVDRQGAFDILRIHARSQRRKMSEMAEEFVKAAETLNMVR